MNTERYGWVRSSTEKSDISFLLPLQFLFPLSRHQINPSVYLRKSAARQSRLPPSDKTFPSITAPAPAQGGSQGRGGSDPN